MNLMENEQILLQYKIKRGIASPIIFLVFILILVGGGIYSYYYFGYDIFYLYIGAGVLSFIGLIAILWLIIACLKMKNSPRIYLTNFRVILFARFIFNEIIVDPHKDGLYTSLPLDKITSVSVVSGDTNKSQYSTLLIYSYNLCLKFGLSKDCAHIYTVLNNLLNNLKKDTNL